MQTLNSKPLFEEIFKGYFKNLKSELTPKVPAYKEIILPMEELFNRDLKNPHPNISKYIPLFKYMLEIKNIRLIESTLNVLQKLLISDMIVLDSPSYIIKTSLNSFQLHRQPEKKLISELIESLLLINFCEKDESLSILLLKVFRLLFFSETGVHSAQFSSYILFFINIYSLAKRNEYLIQIKAHVSSTLALLFQRIKERELSLKSDYQPIITTKKNSINNYQQRDTLSNNNYQINTEIATEYPRNTLLNQNYQDKQHNNFLYHQNNIDLPLKQAIKDPSPKFQSKLSSFSSTHAQSQVTQPLTVKTQQIQKIPEYLSFKEPTFIIQGSFDIFFSSKSSENGFSNPRGDLNKSNPSRTYKQPKKREYSIDFSVLNGNIQSPNSGTFSPGSFFKDKHKNSQCFDFFEFQAQKDRVKGKGSVQFYEGLFEKQENLMMLEEIVRETMNLIVDEVCLGTNLKLIPSADDFLGLKVVSFKGFYNELGFESGRFGWCIICRTKAEFYCRVSRKPICSSNCKRILQENDYKLNKLISMFAFNEKPFLICDFIEILKVCCKITEKDTSSNPCSSDFKAKIFSFEILSSSLDYFGSFFTFYIDYLIDLKNELCETILRNCLSQEKEFFSLGFKLFIILIMNYRELLKDELVVLMEQVFLKLLVSGNSTFSHRFYALQVINKLFRNYRILIEFFLNYDCDINHINIVEKLFETLSKISQGKYLKDSMVLQPNQELSLRNIAFESLYGFLKELIKGFEFEQSNTNNNNNNYNHTEITQTQDGNEGYLPSLTQIGSNENLPDLANSVETEIYEKSRAKKQEIAKGILKFNNKPEQGITHLISIGFLIPNDFKSLAWFLRNTPELDHEKLGQYFAKSDPFIINVLLEFTNLCEFSNLTLDQALRAYLDLFMLPGEAQQVDRILQAFSQKFHKDNPILFRSTEAVYLLSYSMMILQTDLHNPQVKEKMKFQDFLKMTRGINDGNDLPPDYLRILYNSINEKPLAKHQLDKRENIDKSNLFLEEANNILKKGRQQLVQLKKTKNISKNMFLMIHAPTTLKLLLEMIWSPILAAFSVVFESQSPDNDEKFIGTCIDGIEAMIKLTSVIGLNDIRDTFIVTLIKFTNLGLQMAQKHLECLNRLLNLCMTHGKYLASGWKYIIQFLSRLDKLLCKKEELILLQVDPFLLDKVLGNSNSLNGETLLEVIDFLVESSRGELNETDNPRMFSLWKIIEIADCNMDRVRMIWTRLWKKLTEFFSEIGCHRNKKVGFYVVDSLKRLAMKFFQMEEFLSINFQKEVLISFEKIYGNLQTDQIDVKEFLMTCVLSILQNYANKLKSGWKIVLSLIRFALKEEVPNLNLMANRMLKIIVEDPTNMSCFLDSPSEFLQALYQALMNSQESIRLDSIENLLKFFRFLLDSLGILPFTIEQTVFPILEDLSYQTSEKNQSIIEKIHINLSSIAEEIQSIDFLRGNFEDLDLNSMEDSLLSSPGIESKRPFKILINLGEDIWFGVLSHLKELLKDSNSKIRDSGLDAFFSLILSFGYTFTPDFWLKVNKEIIKISLEDMIKSFVFNVEVISMKSQLNKGFSNAAKLIAVYLNDNESFLKEFFGIIRVCTGLNNEFLAKLSLNSFRTVLAKSSKKFSRDSWEFVVKFIKELLIESNPNKLMDRENLEIDFPKNSSELLKGFGNYEAMFRPINLKFNIKEMLTKCVVQLMLVGATKEMVEKNVGSLTNEELDLLHESIEKSYNFSSTFDEQIYLRYCLWKNGFMQEMKQLPGLLRQEREALNCLITIDIQGFNSRLNQDRLKAQRFLDDFIEKSITILNKFNKIAEISHKENKEKSVRIQRKSLSKIIGSRTPEVKSHFSSSKDKVSDFSVYLDDFDLRNLRKSSPLKILKPVFSPIENSEAIETILKGLQNKENYRQINNYSQIICSIINNLNEIKPTHIKNLRNLVIELLNLSKNGFSYCHSCGANDLEDSICSLNEVLLKFYDYAFNKL